MCVWGGGGNKGRWAVHRATRSQGICKNQLHPPEGLQQLHRFQAALQTGEKQDNNKYPRFSRTLTIREAISKERFPGPCPRASLQAGEKGLSPAHSPACAITPTHPLPSLMVQKWTCQLSPPSSQFDREGGQRFPKELTDTSMKGW